MKGRFPGSQEDRQELHPKLKPMMRVFTIMRWVMLGTVVGVAGMFLLLYLNKPQPALLMAAGVTAVVMLLVFVIMDRVLAATLLPRLERTNRLMRSLRPEPMRMHPTGVIDVHGHLVELKPRNALEEAPPWGIATITSSGRRNLSKKPQNVLVYHDSTDSKRTVAVEGEKHVYWGALTNPDQRESSRRIMNRVLFAMLAMLVVMCIVFIMLTDMRMDEVREESRLAELSSQWPTARGAVTASSVEEARIRQGKGTVRGYRAEVVYTYLAQGEEHTGGLIHFCYAPTRSLEYAESLVARYPKGAMVDVAYDPEAPGVSVLEPGYTEPCRSAEKSAWREMAMIGVMIALALVAFGGMYWWQRRKHSQAAARLGRHGIRF